MHSLNSLRELLVDEIRDLHNAETQLLRALPKMAAAATNPGLRDCFVRHLTQTESQVERLERVFKILGESSSGKTCHAMKGLIEEGEQGIKTKGPEAVRDANLIGAAQRVEHYEMAAYGTARAFAEQLGEDEVAGLLQKTLDEENDANNRLTAIATVVNADAQVAV
ncbi:MAG TPA: ferritin-like domain-containing protein [Candidatus Didemnitutus sp.]|nr:ferritin-like domain-containing protein [Candidatus Didemnitutus sp.]